MAREIWLTLTNVFRTFFEWFGELALFSARVVRASLRAPWESGELLRQLDAIGSKSFPLVALAEPPRAWCWRYKHAIA